MSVSSKSVHDATVALRDAANAVVALGRAASALSEAMNSIVALEERIEALERTIALPKAVEVTADGTGMDIKMMGWLAMRSHVDTKTAAALLGRAPQTLRKWACCEAGPLRPVRINCRLAWAVADIRRLLQPV